MYFYYTSRPLPGVVFPVLYGGIVYVLASGLTPMSVLTKFASFNIGLLATSRVSCRTLLMLFFSSSIVLTLLLFIVVLTVIYLAKV